LFKCKKIIGFTGSLSTPAYELITVDRQTLFSTLRYPNLSKSDKKEINNTITYMETGDQDAKSERESLIIDTVKK